jgi:hypothetical protein
MGPLQNLIAELIRDQAQYRDSSAADGLALRFVKVLDDVVGVLAAKVVALEATVAANAEAGRQTVAATADLMRELAADRILPDNVLVPVLRAIADLLDPEPTPPTNAMALCPACECPRLVEENPKIAGLVTCSVCGEIFAEQDVDSTGLAADLPPG